MLRSMLLLPRILLRCPLATRLVNMAKRSNTTTTPTMIKEIVKRRPVGLNGWI